MKNKVNRKKEKRPNKAYVAWEDNEISSSSDEESRKLTLMTSHHSDNEENKVRDSKINEIPSNDELQNSFHELHEECLNLSRKCSKQKKLILSLERKANDTNVELDKVKNVACNKCQEHESKIVELNQIIEK